MNEKTLAAGVAGVLIGMGVVLGWQSYTTPKTWEQCMESKLASANSDSAIGALNQICRQYPRAKASN